MAAFFRPLAGAAAVLASLAIAASAAAAMPVAHPSVTVATSNVVKAAMMETAITTATILTDMSCMRHSPASKAVADDSRCAFRACL